MKEHKLINFVDTIQTKVGLQRKKTKLGANRELYECFYRWFLTKRIEGVPLSEPILKSQAAKFHHDLHVNNNFFASDSWFSGWKYRHGISQSSIDGEAQSCESESVALFTHELKKNYD